MIMSYEELEPLLGFPFLANLCGGVDCLWRETSNRCEYGISWNEFLEEHRAECEQKIKDWLEERSDKEIIGWLELQNSNYLCEIERLDKKRQAIRRYIEYIDDYLSDGDGVEKRIDFFKNVKEARLDVVAEYDKRRFPVVVNGRELEAVIFPYRREATVLVGLFLSDQRCSRKTINFGANGSITEEFDGVTESDLTDHEPDFSGLTLEEIADTIAMAFANRAA